ncbi:MAG: hypothetical protein MJ153_07070 [Clostridia bacterium]|nr:hypothetical protein [Clostridia bacterium]
MSSVLFNLKRSFLQHYKSNLLILINMILSTAAIFILLQNFYYLRQQYNEIYGTTEVAHNYQIMIENIDQLQNYKNDRINKSPMYYVGKEVIREIENKYNLKFYYSLNGDLYPEDMDTPAIWTAFSVYDDFAGCEYIDIHFLDSAAFDVYGLKLTEGNLFSDNDYNSENTDKPISVIMGNNYRNCFKIGDTFTYDGDTAKIIGFLESGTTINEMGYEYSYDNSMFFPQLFPRIKDESNVFREEFSYIHCNDDSLDVQDAINTVTAKSGYYTLSLFPLDGIQITSTKDISEKNVKLIGILALIACTICTLSLASILVNRTLQDRDIYCIYLCCGIPLWKINLSISIEMFLYLLLSFFPTIGISIIEYNELIVPLWQILLFAGTITFISLLPTFIANRKCNIDLLIRDKIA